MQTVKPWDPLPWTKVRMCLLLGQQGEVRNQSRCYGHEVFNKDNEHFGGRISHLLSHGRRSWCPVAGGWWHQRLVLLLLAGAAAAAGTCMDGIQHLDLHAKELDGSSPCLVTTAKHVFALGALFCWQCYARQRSASPKAETSVVGPMQSSKQNDNVLFTPGTMCWYHVPWT